MKKDYANYNNISVILLVLILPLIGCKKDFLNAKPSTAIVIPKTLTDFQQLLDYGSINRLSSLPQLSSDDYFITSEAAWKSSSPTERNAYVWDKNTFGGQLERADWNAPYTSVFYANSVLNGLSSNIFNSSESGEYNNIKGQAYFIRAFALFDLAKNFSPPYDAITAEKDLGIPLKLTPDVDQLLRRSSVQETYNQIISDLTKSAQLLNTKLPSQYRNRASKPAAYALLSRVFLSMRDYIKAELYADSCLSIQNELIDYNTVNRNSTTPFASTNSEVILWAIQSVGGYNNTLCNSPASINIDTSLLASYDSNDLRRVLYFITNSSTGLTKARTGYAAIILPFVGLATDEIYLIKAECAARRNDIVIALNFINNLLVKRYTTGTYVPYNTASSSDLLGFILSERRKELVWRGSLRWDDLRRLNKEGANITLKRNLNGKTYELAPNSPLYVFPIPDDEIRLSGIQQNLR